jgi:hypothetical protein
MRGFSKVLAIAPVLVFSSAPGHATPQEDVMAVLLKWVEAYGNNAKSVTALYAPLARYRGMEGYASLGPEAIEENLYFRAFNYPAFWATLWGHSCRVLDDTTASCFGEYELVQASRAGEMTNEMARFSMSMTNEPDGSWWITDHLTMRMDPLEACLYTQASLSAKDPAGVECLAQTAAAKQPLTTGTVEPAAIPAK